jgi:DNA helicase-2/ATP-dependent DNA helicase PcrA
LPEAPKLLEDTDRAIFFEQILSQHEWEYLRPRGDSMRYFRDLMSLASLLKRERISSADFKKEVTKAIKFLENDEGSISSRGENKGEIKKEVLKEIESLKRSEEIVKFLDLYGEAKKEKRVLDYDDVLECLVKIVETSEEALAQIRERYLYVLVDEHQDSSRVQNEFLARVWAAVERPDIFVVGDDRQLIYGFSGASIDHFKGFQKTFSDAKLITLVDNYRSTQVILDASHALLKSVMSEQKLFSQSKEKHPIQLLEADTPDQEIVALGLDLKEKMKHGLKSDNCALLVPKNRQVLNALKILHDLGIPVSAGEALSLFDHDDARAFLRVLKIIDTGDRVSLALSFLDEISGITPLAAHAFLAGEYMREFSLEKLLSRPPSLFAGNNGVESWISKLTKWKDDSKKNKLESFIKKIGEEIFKDESKGRLVSGGEITETILDLLKREQEKNSEITLSQFVSYLEKLEYYGEHIPLVSAKREGVKVLTMHSSKGLEFEYVWIAHMDERSLSGGKRMGFTLPHAIKERVEESDIDAIKRKLYVAITRAKRFCALSYSTSSIKGGEQELARVIAELPSEVFEKQKFNSPKIIREKISENNNLQDIIKLAAGKYKDRYVSVSLLNNFFDCPWQWYFRNLLQIPEPQAETLEFGIVVHATVDRILKMKNVPVAEDVKRIIAEEVLKREFGGPLDRARMEREALNIVLPWIKNRLPEINTSRKTEESISLNSKDFPHLKIYGKIDLIENLNDKEVRVTDFKTGGVRKKSDIEKLDEEGRMSGNLRQLAMYSYLLSENPKWNISVSQSRLEFLEAKNPKEIFYDRVISKKEIELLKKDIRDYDELLKTGGWIERECHYNSYGKNIECEYCKMSEMYK